MAHTRPSNRSSNRIILKTARSPKPPTFKEAFENINRTKPVRLNLSGSNPPASKGAASEVIKSPYFSIPTEAELDFYQGGLRLPNKAENLAKLLADQRKTGRFDYELCYLLRKQETQEELQDWVTAVWKKRCEGDDEFGKDADPNRFNQVMESGLRRSRTPHLFRKAFISLLMNG